MAIVDRGYDRDCSDRWVYDRQRREERQHLQCDATFPLSDCDNRLGTVRGSYGIRG
jgi:hypothetical protein